MRDIIILWCTGFFTFRLKQKLRIRFTNEIKHIITQNEGSAVGIAIGNFLASGIASVVYLRIQD